jgi:hypothetical protein
VKIINKSLTKDIGVNFVVKSYRIVTVENLLVMLKDDVNKNFRDDEETLSVRQAISEILLTYFNKLEESLIIFKQKEYLFIDIIDIEIKKLE